MRLYCVGTMQYKGLLLLSLQITLSLAVRIVPAGTSLENNRTLNVLSKNDVLDKPIESSPGSKSTSSLKPCQQLQKDWRRLSITEGEPYEEQNLRVTLIWEGILGQAANALLRATLIAAGYDSNGVKLYNRDYKDRHFLSNQSLIVEVSTAALLHVRLTPEANANVDCKNASTLPLDKYDKILQHCEFRVPGRKISEQAIIYILNEWDRTCAAEIIRQFAARNYVWIDVVYLERSHLKHLLVESDHSFYFLDTSHWTNIQGVRVAQLPESAIEAAHCALNLDKTVAVKANDEFSPALSEILAVFSPSQDDLNEVIELKTQKNTIEEAACEWARHQRSVFNPWRKAAVVKPLLRKVAVIICKMEIRDLGEYVYLKGLIENSKGIFSTSSDVNQRFQIQLYYIDCLDTDWLVRKLLNWFSKNIVSQMAGVLLTEEIATAAAPLAEKLQLPLLTFDVSSNKPVVRSATGRLKYLELAIRRLLADCGWRRLAIVSESTRLAIELSAALQSPTAGLVVREANVTSTQSGGIRHALIELLAIKAKVFLVNAGAVTAANVLAIAQELNITWNNGFTWIVREYNTADDATVATRPYSVSFWWRGKAESKTDQSDVAREINKGHKVEEASKSNKSVQINYEIDETHDGYKASKDVHEKELRKKLETRWHGRAWPLYAAPLLDALLTFGGGLKAMNSYRNTWFNNHRDGSLRMFWNCVHQRNISGILEDLSYDEYGVSAPLVFIEQWGAEPRPRLLATWRSGEWRESAEACPSNDYRNDGFVHCLVPAGDPFHPSCRDALWFTSLILFLIVSVALIVVAIWWTRRAMIKHDNRIKTEFAKRLLERRERVFAALAEHLVERSVLELHQELGNGRFGRVHLGVLREPGRKGRNVVVAAKALREEAAPAEESEFLKEACTLSSLDHEHIVRFIGVCVVDGPPLILMEHAFFGDLLHYLQDRRYLADGATNPEKMVSTGVGLEEKAYVSAEALTRLAHEAASALSYIAQRGIVHRDVRASNCLVDERRSLKLADFGLARATGTVDGEYACRRGMFPVLWMAPESLATGVSSVASDVWSFGVLVFELVTLGRRPYGSKPPPSVLRHVVAGGRPQLPWDASAETRALVRACWRREPEARPTPARLMEWLCIRRRALRPALVTELVDIDSQVYSISEINDFDLDGSKKPLSDTT